VEQSVAHCLKAAVAQGEISENLKCNEVAGFIVSSLQGAILLAKAQRSLLPVERFEKVLFSSVLK
jgi:TetR/AcrR family transcriptional repressor of nem operon